MYVFHHIGYFNFLL